MVTLLMRHLRDVSFSCTREVLHPHSHFIDRELALMPTSTLSFPYAIALWNNLSLSLHNLNSLQSQLKYVLSSTKVISAAA